MPYSSSRHSGSSLERHPDHSGSIAGENSGEWSYEENSRQHPDPLFENGQTPKIDLLVETEPTQTQHPISKPMDHITDIFLRQLKDKLEVSAVVSLNQLVSGTSKRTAAQLFYQICVLATQGFVRVEQDEPYEDIHISKGTKM